MAFGTTIFSHQSKKLIARLAREVACEAYNIPHADIYAPCRGDATISEARQTAMYLCHVICHLTISEVAELFERNRSTVSHACVNIENRREGPAFNEQMDYMEDRLRQRIKAFDGRRSAGESRVRERKSLAVRKELARRFNTVALAG